MRCSKRRLVLRLCRNRSPFWYWSQGHVVGDRPLKRLSLSLGLALATIGFIVSSAFWVSAAPLSKNLPPLQVHPLPSTLANWRDRSNQGDYFDQIQPLPVGALIWSQFPVKVYIESPTVTASTESPTVAAAKLDDKQAQTWTLAVTAAVTEWQAYLPLQVVAHPEPADITIWRSPPPWVKGGVKPGDRNYRVRSAETRYELYIQETDNTRSVLSHRCTVWLRPSQTPQYIQAAARHELGHALGLWGHSPLQTDALYFSQVRNPAAISSRDVNTLRRIYQQPTRLGWVLPAATPLE
jgi:predicted Zn-dependent protease